MKTLKYVAKRIALLFFVLFVIVTICFILVRLLPLPVPEGVSTDQREATLRKWKNSGYDISGITGLEEDRIPMLEQYGIYLTKIVTKFDFGQSMKIDAKYSALELMMGRLLPTVLVNVYSLVFSIPIGIALGIYAAIKKNKWQDSVISTVVMVFVSVPSYVYAFLIQYFLYFKLHLFDKSTVLALADAGNSWFSPAMTWSMVMPVLALSFGTIAGLTRFTRAELTETLTSDYMLLARTKGLTRAQATSRHALKNAMVPILPMIISSFVGILGGSFVIENIFGIVGVGNLYMRSVQQLDYSVFMLDTIFYTLISLSTGIVVDLSYGFIDPRIRMGER